jgi:hypothetical protein
MSLAYRIKKKERRLVSFYFFEFDHIQTVEDMPPELLHRIQRQEYYYPGLLARIVDIHEVRAKKKLLEDAANEQENRS